MATVIKPYKSSSESAKLLADALGILRLRLKSSKFMDKDGNIVINWGNSSTSYKKAKVINKDIRIASDKLVFFQSLAKDSPIPEYTTSYQNALEWILEGHKVCCRTILNGNSGDGLVLATNKDELVQAPLYTKYVPKKDEYRIHCYKNSDGLCNVFHKQRKAKRKDAGNVNYHIRNHDNGFVFVIGDCNPPDEVIDSALDVFRQTGLDFGAVDVGYNQARNMAIVYEVNTAPGLEGTTLEKYVEMFKEIL